MSTAKAKPAPLARLLLLLLGAYQAFRAGRPSPCRLVPSCSAYAVEAIEMHGALRGPVGRQRVARCRPFGSRGFDPVSS